MVAMTLYTSKRRSTSSARREPRVIIHLRHLLAQILEMSADERKQTAEIQWIPSERCIKRLLDDTLRQYERVEIIIGEYKADVGGESPSWDTVGGVLGISREMARQYGGELVRRERARKVRGHLVLKHGRYLHFFRRKTADIPS